MLMEASKHEPEIASKPAGREGCDLLFESIEIVAAIVNFAAKYPGPNLRHRFAGQGIGADESDQLMTAYLTATNWQAAPPSTKMCQITLWKRRRSIK
jgi:hypothetical protein